MSKKFRILMLKGFKAYDVKAKSKVNIEEPKLVTLKNGAGAIKGVSDVTGNKVMTILSKEKFDSLKKKK